MKVVILCGGKGTRMREETEYRPKPLVMVGDRPILWHIMKLYSHYGFNDFVLCLGYKGDMIKDYFLNYDEFTHDFTLSLGNGVKKIQHHDNGTPKWNITFVNTGLESGTAERISQIKKYIGDDEHFLLTYGDGVANVDVARLIQFHKEHGKIVTVTGVKPPNPFGVLEIDGHSVKTFAEKPQSQDWTNGGFFVCSNEIFNHVGSDTSSMLEFDTLPTLSHVNQVAMYHHNDFWQCIDTLKHL
jgi:glucose-1-phosphate cytidylyltransferase